MFTRYLGQIAGRERPSRETRSRRSRRKYLTGSLKSLKSLKRTTKISARDGLGRWQQAKLNCLPLSIQKIRVYKVTMQATNTLVCKTITHGVSNCSVIISIVMCQFWKSMNFPAQSAIGFRPIRTCAVSQLFYSAS